MNAKNLLLSVFVILTVVFASLTVGELYQVNTLNSQLMTQSKSTLTQTLSSTTTITSTTVVNNYITSTSTFTTTVIPPSNVTGLFTYAPIGQVRVGSALALIRTQPQSGEQNVIFSVTIENVGNSPIYFIGGWVNSLSSSVPTNSPVLQETPWPRCGGGIFITTLNHGQNYTLFAPDCGLGFNYKLVQAGRVNVGLSFNWTTNKQENTPFSNSTTISAQFTLP
jgi:hypothetical protein